MALRSTRFACLFAAAIAASAPAIAAAQPAKRPAQKPAATAAAKAPATTATAEPATSAPGEENKPKEGGSGGMIALVVIGGLVVVGGGIVAMRVFGGGGSRKEEPINPERQHDWELKMSEEQERAMLKGIEAYRDAGHSLLFYHREAMIRFYEPYALVSLHRVSDAFLAAGPAGMTDPAGAVANILNGLLASESPGVLLLKKDEWYAPPIGGLDNLKFTNLCYDVLTRPEPYLEGTQGSGADEGTGVMELHMNVAGPLNTFSVDLSRVLAEAHRARAAQPGVPLIELIRPILAGMARGQISGGMWMRGGAAPQEVALVERSVATSKHRPSDD